MEIYLIIIFLGSLIFFSHLFNKLFSMTKIPNVLLLLGIGVLIGPVFHIVDKASFFGEVGPIFTTVTLIVVLFESGVDLKLSEVGKNIAQSFFMTTFNFLVSAVSVALVGKYLGGLDWLSASFLGAILGGTSAAVVIPIVRQLKMGEKSSAYLFLESALSDVLCLVVGLAILEGIKLGVINIKDILQTMGISFLFAAVLGVAAGIFWAFILARIREIQNSIFTTFAFVFVVYGIVESLGLNGGIAVLVFGIAMGNIGDKKHLIGRLSFERSSLDSIDRRFFSEVVFVLQTYFFVYVGINLEFGSYYTYVLALIALGGILLFRPFSVKFFVTGKKIISYRDMSVMSVMGPKGLVPAILAGIPLQAYMSGQMPEWFTQEYGETIKGIAYAMVLVSIVVCSFLVIIAGRPNSSFLFFRPLFYRSSKDNQPLPEGAEDQSELSEGTEDTGDDYEEPPADQDR